VAPRVKLSSSESDDELRRGDAQDKRQTSTEEDLHHQTVPSKSSYAAQMKTLENHRSSNFTAREYHSRSQIEPQWPNPARAQHLAVDSTYCPNPRRRREGDVNQRHGRRRAESRRAAGRENPDRTIVLPAQPHRPPLPLRDPGAAAPAPSSTQCQAGRPGDKHLQPGQHDDPFHSFMAARPTAFGGSRWLKTGEPAGGG
jgi:hypothetical protein